MENYTESLYYAEKALETDSSNTDAKQRICDSLKNLNMHEEADVCATAFFSEDPYNYELIEMKFYELKYKILNRRISNI